MTEGAWGTLDLEQMDGIPTIQFLVSTDLDIPEIGGKASNLAQMISGGFPVPPGFVVTVNAHGDFLTSNHMRENTRLPRPHGHWVAILENHSEGRNNDDSHYLRVVGGRNRVCPSWKKNGPWS